MARLRFQAIEKYLEGSNPVVAEVGVAEGRLSRLLRQRTENLYLIDSWTADVSDAYKKTGDKKAFLSQQQHESNYQKVCQIDAVIIRDYSVKAAQRFADNYFDLVFLDADHSYEGVKSDIEAWLPKTRILSGHDYGLFGVKKAVDELEISILEFGQDNTWFYDTQR